MGLLTAFAIAKDPQAARVWGQGTRGDHEEIYSRQASNFRLRSKLDPQGV